MGAACLCSCPKIDCSKVSDKCEDYSSTDGSTDAKGFENNTDQDHASPAPYTERILASQQSTITSHNTALPGLINP